VIKLIAAIVAAYLMLSIAIPMATKGLAQAVTASVQSNALDSASVAEMVSRCVNAECVDDAITASKSAETGVQK